MRITLLRLLWCPGRIEQVTVGPVDEVADIPFPEGILAGIFDEKMRVEITVSGKEVERLALFKRCEDLRVGSIPFEDDDRVQGGERQQTPFPHDPPDICDRTPVRIVLVCCHKAAELFPDG